MDLKSKEMKRALFLISFAIILMWVLDNFSMFLDIGSRILTILSPFIIGIIIAFLFNRPMEFIERYLFGQKGLFKNAKKGLKRPVSYSITLILFIVIIFIMLFMVIPELVDTVEDLGSNMPLYIEKVGGFFEGKLEGNTEIAEKIGELNWNKIQEDAISFLKRNSRDWLDSSFSFASSVVGSLFTFGLAFVFSAYVLLEKEKLILQTKKVILAYFPENLSKKIFHIGDLSNNAFMGFVSGKLRESLVIIVLFFAVMSILKFPYSLLISILIGTLTLIPWFGAFIGFTLAFLLILVVDAKMAFWFIIVFLALYEIEGNLIYPIVVGKASGLASIWIFVAGIIGGSIGGLAGIILSIPIFSVLFTLLKESVEYRLKKKDINNLD